MSKKQRDPRQRQETLATLLMPVYEGKLEENLGNRLRELRRQQGFSLRALAEVSGLSANTLSLIENGKTSPSVATLQQIAIALAIPITTFFEIGTNRDPVLLTQKAQRSPVPFSHGTLEELGSGIGVEGLQPFIITFDAHTDSGTTLLSHEGSEFVYCLSGKIIFTILGQEYPIDPGDSLVFSAKMPHSWRNPLDTPTQVIIVMAPTEETHHSPRIQYPV